MYNIFQNVNYNLCNFFLNYNHNYLSYKKITNEKNGVGET